MSTAATTVMASAPDSRTSKHRRRWKRSSSSTFSSLFATLASFSSPNALPSGTPRIHTAPPLSKTSSSLPLTVIADRSHGGSNSPDVGLSLAMTPTRHTASRLLVRRATTPTQQATRPAQSTQSSPGNRLRPDVFSFMERGEASSPPTPRRRASPVRALGTSPADTEVVARPVHNERVYSSPIPKRPLLLTTDSGQSVESRSDASVPASVVTSSPGNSSPREASALVTYKPPSSEPVTTKDAGGKSIREEDFCEKEKKKGKYASKQATPPEAPCQPHIQQQQQQEEAEAAPNAAQQTQQPLPFDHQSLMQSSPFLSFQMPSGMFYPATQAYSMPYPTPPLEPFHQPFQQISPSIPNMALGNDPIQQSNPSPVRKPLQLSLPTDIPAHPIDLPRQYRTLTQTTLKRLELLVDGLEEELATLDHTPAYLLQRSDPHRQAPPGWQRDQMVMRLGNALAMHHRLLDTWSKVSQLPRLASARPHLRSQLEKDNAKDKLDAVAAQLRREYGHFTHIRGVEVDRYVSSIVNDLVCVGEDATSMSSQGDPGRNGTWNGYRHVAGHELGERRRLALLFAGVMVFVVLQDGFLPRLAIATVLSVGIYLVLYVDEDLFSRRLGVKAGMDGTRAGRAGHAGQNGRSANPATR